MSAAAHIDPALLLSARYGHLREMARAFGTLAADRRSGRATTYYLRFNLDGTVYRIRRVPVGRSWIRIGTNRDLAREVLDEIRADIRRGAGQLQAIAPYLGEDAEEVSFRRHWSEFVAAKKLLHEQGRLSAGRIFELRRHEPRGHLDPLLGLSIHSIRFRELEDWQGWLFTARGLGPRSVHHLVADVGTCLRWCLRRGDLVSVPELPTTPIPDHEPSIPTPEQQDRLLAAIPWEVAGYFLARGFMGIRDEEAARANVGDYHFGEPDAEGRYLDQLTVRAKGSRRRTVPVDHEVARWVREVHDSRRLEAWPAMADGPLFPNPRAMGADKRWTPASRRRVMIAAMEAAGVKTRPNEALRHCYGTRIANHLLRDGATAGDASRKIMAMMGHTSVSTSNRYVKLAAESLRDMVRKGPR